MVLYSIFGFFDWAIYSMVRFCVRLIMLIANYDFFDEGAIGDIAEKVYVVLGVLMLFKMVITAIQYMINPDTFDDKDKGMGGLLTKMAVAMALLVLIDPIFSFAKYMQQTIVSTIPGIILNTGEDYSLKSGDAYQGISGGGGGVLDEISDRVAGTTIQAFVTPKTDGDHQKNIEKNGQQMNAGDRTNQRIETFRNNITSGCSGRVIPFEALDVGKCDYDYMFGISTVAGIFLLYVMLSMTLDIAIRSIKLGILQILAPIPISSYIISKDKLQKFFKLASSVYIDLFVRLGIIYFIIFFIKIIIENMDNGVTIGDSYTASSFEAAFVKIAIIIALFMFAKNAPKFICEVLGINGDGFGDMKDMFKPAWQRTGGLASLGASIGAYRNSRDYGEGRIKALGRAASAGANATASRLKAIASGKDLAESYKTAKDATAARTNRNLEYANRYPKFWERQGKKISEKFDAYTGVTTGGKKASGTISAANTLLDGRGHSWKRAEDKVLEAPGEYHRATTIRFADGTSHSYTVSQMVTRMKVLEAGGSNLTADEKMELQALTDNRQKILDTAKQEFIERSFMVEVQDPNDPNSTLKGDPQQRNVFAEDIYKFARSGGDPEEIGKVLIQENYEYKDSTGAIQHINLNLKKLADKIVEGNEPLTREEAEALSHFIAKDMNKLGGRMRAQATKTQTSEPKSS